MENYTNTKNTTVHYYETQLKSQNKQSTAFVNTFPVEEKGLEAAI